LNTDSAIVSANLGLDTLRTAMGMYFIVSIPSASIDTPPKSVADAECVMDVKSDISSRPAIGSPNNRQSDRSGVPIAELGVDTGHDVSDPKLAILLCVPSATRTWPSSSNCNIASFARRSGVAHRLSEELESTRGSDGSEFRLEQDADLPRY
jgi:hypothetical protein